MKRVLGPLDLRARWETGREGGHGLELESVLDEEVMQRLVGEVDAELQGESDRNQGG